MTDAISCRQTRFNSILHLNDRCSRNFYTSRFGQTEAAFSFARLGLFRGATVHALRALPADLPDLRRHQARAKQPARTHRADAGHRR